METLAKGMLVRAINVPGHMVVVLPLAPQPRYAAMMKLIIAVTEALGFSAPSMDRLFQAAGASSNSDSHWRQSKLSHADLAAFY